MGRRGVRPLPPIVPAAGMQGTKLHAKRRMSFSARQAQTRDDLCVRRASAKRKSKNMKLQMCSESTKNEKKTARGQNNKGGRKGGSAVVYFGEGRRMPNFAKEISGPADAESHAKHPKKAGQIAKEKLPMMQNKILTHPRQ